MRESVHDGQGRSGFAERRFCLTRRSEVTRMGCPASLDWRCAGDFGRFSDNIPGVGIGRKTAAGLILEHGGLESLLGNLGAVKSLKSREKLQNGRDQILQNRKMVELDCRTELPLPIDQLGFVRIIRD